MGFAYFEVVRWTLCFFCAICVAFSGGGCGETETPVTLDGKGAAQWRAMLDDPETREAAATRLAESGEASAPILIALLDEPRGVAPLVSAAMLGEMLQGATGERAAAAVAALTQAIGARHSIVRAPAAMALGSIGAAAGSALPELQALCDSEQERPQVRIAGAFGVWGITGDLARVMPTLLVCLKSEEAPARLAATQLAAQIGAAAVEPLMVALDSGDPMLRGGAALALAHIGKAAAPARRKLYALLKDKDPHVQDAAQIALDSLR